MEKGEVMPRIITKLFFLIAPLTLTCLALDKAYAQTVTSGAIRGVVYELATKSPIIGATVTVTNRDTGLVRSALTSASGEYFIRMLPVGVYTIIGSMQGYEVVPTSTTNIPVRILDPSVVTPPPIELRKLGTVAPTPSATPAAPAPAPATAPAGQPATSTGDEPSSEQLVNTANASRTQHFDERQLAALPFSGIRTFDDLALLAAGVAPPPLAIGNQVGPGVGPGVGTSGQFAINGIRSRANNFTIDGSDNNDEDIGVRRQGFTSLVPQSIESMQAVQITTLLPEPQLGRNMGGQVNAVSRSGGRDFHGTLYGFLTDRRLKARDTFDLTGGPATFPLTRADGTAVRIGRLTTAGQLADVRPLAPANPVGGENPFTRGQYGFVFGGPLVKDWTNFFVSYEHQDINASRESHFAVPTVAHRGLFSSGEVGLRDSQGNAVFPTSIPGNAFLSLYPFPNNPGGPYGPATFTQVLPASADGNIFSFKLDQNIDAFGNRQLLSGRYNFTDDDSILPVTGEALFSTLRSFVRTHNLSLILNSPLSPRAANQFRLSYGRTSLRFEEVRNPFLLPGGKNLTNPRERQFLLNAPYIYNTSGAAESFFQIVEGFDTENITGPLGQVVVTGYSPIGVDVFNFPQQRTNNTYQLADTYIYDFSKHRISAGLDVRWTHLNSFLDRNFRPLAVFNGAQDVARIVDPSTPTINPQGFYFGRDYLAVGAPTGFFQTFSRGTPDSTIGLRYWQNNVFIADQIRPASNFSLTLGLRYELNTVPREMNRRIESTFNSPEVRQFIDIERLLTGSVFGRAESGFESFLAGRFKIYKSDANNIAPHAAFAWDPFKTGKTAIRGGYSIYYDQILGSVISQSRNVFPNFLTINFGGFNPDCRVNPSGCIQTLFHRLVAENPSFTYATPGTLNRYNGAFGDPVLAMINAAFLTNVTTGPGFILPDAHLKTPYSQHWGLTFEREFLRDFLLSVGYVGTKGTNLLRVATPNLGQNSIAYVSNILSEQPFPNLPNLRFPVFFGINVPPSRSGQIPDFRPFPLLGSFTSIESDANSNYHSLQVQLNKRFAHGVQFTTAYTWSHAIDEVSDLFDLAGAPALPQDSFNRAAERGDANFDVRHRFAYSFIWDLPGFDRSDILGGWQLASTGSFQTAQPYSVLFCCDINRDGNASDRISFLSATAADPGSAPRNTFRAQNAAFVNLAINKIIRFGEDNQVEIRSEFFNLFNRPHYGIPINRLFFGNQSIEPLTRKDYTDTRLPARTVQFGLRYRF
jgi:hypothetical protein